MTSLPPEKTELLRTAELLTWGTVQGNWKKITVTKILEAVKVCYFRSRYLPGLTMHRIIGEYAQSDGSLLPVHIPGLLELSYCLSAIGNICLKDIAEPFTVTVGKITSDHETALRQELHQEALNLARQRSADMAKLARSRVLPAGDGR